MAVPQPQPFGGLLKRARRAAGLTQEAFAAQVGYSLSYIGMLERGERTPAPATVTLFAEALQVNAPEQTVWLAAAEKQRLASPAPPAPASPAHAGPPLAGRATELSRIEQHLSGNGPPVLLLAGEPGIGKSRLLAAASARATTLGWAVLVGGCHRASGQEPYAPLLEAVKHHLQRQSPVQQRLTLQGCAWLVRLLPELAETRLVPAPSWTLSPEHERRLLFAAVAHYLSNVADRAGTLLVLDDLQWAGADALDLLASLLRLEEAPPLRVVGAYRSTEVRPPDPLGVLLADLGAMGLAAQHLLGPLAAQEARDLFDTLLAGEESIEQTLREQVLARTGGVPFFLVSCAQALRADAPEGPPTQEVPWNVTQSIRQRAAALPQAAQEVLLAAAIVGRRAPRPLLVRVAGVLGHNQQEVLSALEAACQARLLVEAGADDYTFSHDLVHDVLLADLSAARQAALHQQVAEALEQLPARQREGRAAELAWHWLEAEDAERALPYALLAGDQAEAAYAHQDAERHYQTARDLAHELGDQHQEAAAQEKLGAVCELLARFSQAEEHLEAALALYQATGDVEGQGRALARLGQGQTPIWTPAHRIAWIVPRLAPLSASGLSLGGQTTLYIALARLYTIADRYAESLVAAEHAVVLARAATNDRLLYQAQMRRGTALLGLERQDEGVAVLEETLPLLEATGDLGHLSVALLNLGETYQAWGEFEQARHYFERTLEIAERIGDLHGIVYTTLKRAALAFTLGEWRQVRLDCERAATHSQHVVGLSRYFGWSLHQRGILSRVEGNAEAASHALHQAMELAEREGYPMLSIMASLVLAEWELLEGRSEAVCARLERFLARADLMENVDARLWVLHLLGRAYTERGAVEQAEPLLTQAHTQATALRLRFTLMEVLRAQGLLALRQAHWQEAAHMLEESLALCQAMHTPYEEAIVLYFYGLLSKEQGEPEQARERLEAALAILHRLGERLYTEQVEQTLAVLEG